MSLAPYADRTLFFGRDQEAREIIVSVQLVPKSVLSVIDLFLHDSHLPFVYLFIVASSTDVSLLLQIEPFECFLLNQLYTDSSVVDGTSDMLLVPKIQIHALCILILHLVHFVQASVNTALFQITQDATPFRSFTMRSLRLATVFPRRLSFLCFPQISPSFFPKIVFGKNTAFLGNSREIFGKPSISETLDFTAFSATS